MSDNLPATSAEQMTTDRLMEILSGAGVIDRKGDGYGATRMRAKGNVFQTDTDVWMSNPKTDEPAFTARLMGQPEQYQAFWFDKAKAERAGRPEMADRMCRSRYNVGEENKEYGTNGASCRACIFKPYGDERQKCSWKGDLRFQIVPDDGNMTGDEDIYEISLSTTGMIEFRGTARDPMAGSATKTNFMAKLGRYCAENKAEEWDVSADQAVLIGLTALNEGLVAAEFRLVEQSNEQLGHTWSVVSLTPVFVEMPDQGTLQLEAGEEDEEVIEGEVSTEADSGSDNLDSVPF